MTREVPANREAECFESETKPVKPEQPPQKAQEAGGRGGLDPTRYGDWEKAGRCIDF